LSTSLKRLVEILVVGVALSLAILALLPGGAAEAQPAVAQPASSYDEPQVPATTQPGVVAGEPQTRPTITVSPGDSLWSIVQQKLNPGATPQQVMLEVQQIYELNRDRIGADPDLIFPGQEFLVPAPPQTAEPDASQQPPTTWGSVVPEEQQQPAPTTTPAAAKQPAVWQGEEEPIVTSEPPTALAPEEPALPAEEPAAAPEEPSAPQPPVSESTPTPEQQQQAPEPARPEQQQASEPVNDRDTLSNNTNNNAPRDEEGTPPSLVAGIVDPLIGFYEEHMDQRRLLGVGVLALTALVALLMARKLPLKRRFDDARVLGETPPPPGQDHREPHPATGSSSVEENNAAASSAPPAATTEEASDKPAWGDGGESPYPSLAAQRRHERLRRIRQRTLRQQSGPRPPGW
jgi:LysM repeat protein